MYRLGIPVAFKKIATSEYRRPLSASLVSSFLVQVRSIQYTQTSQTMGALRDRKKTKEAVKWITKSTKDFMKESDTRKSHAAPSLLKDTKPEGSPSLERRERYKEIQEQAESKLENELVRMRDDTNRRWKKGYTFFKRQGKAFTIMYMIAYFGTFLLLYVGFATNFLKKEAAFEFMFVLLGKYIERDWFYERIEAWDNKINLGFAFVINEMLELIRFPLVIFVFYQLRPFIGRSHRGMRKSIFRMNAAES